MDNPVFSELETLESSVASMKVGGSGYSVMDEKEEDTITRVVCTSLGFVVVVGDDDDRGGGCKARCPVKDDDIVVILEL